MVIVDIDHPDIETYINWKMIEEHKVAALVTGSRINNRCLGAVMDACQEGEGDTRFNPKKNAVLKKAILAARKHEVSENYIQRIIQFARQGYTTVEFETYDTDWDSDAYLTMSGQNSNNSVRVFVIALGVRLDEGEVWDY